MVFWHLPQLTLPPSHTTHTNNTGLNANKRSNWALLCCGEWVCATATKGARVIQVSTPLDVGWWETFINLTASLVMQLCSCWWGFPKEHKGAGCLQVTLHQFFNTTHKLFLSHCFVSCIFLQHCIKTSLGPVTDLIVARDRCRCTQPATEWLARTILFLVSALLMEIQSSLVQ